jgi:type IV pilus assembly protein PilV
MEVKMQHRMKSQNGFSMIEVLVAMTILAIGLLGVAGMQITAIKTNSQANTLSAATGMAEGILEEILSWQTTNPIFATTSAAPVVWDFNPLVADVQDSTVLAGGGSYKATYTITKDDPVDNVSRVSVTVSGTRNQTLVGYKRYVD